MGFWYYFWTGNFLIAGSAFALITVVVLVRGSKDLLEMFARLRESKPPQGLSTQHSSTKRGKGSAL
jgi:hypothetical protein